jgi:hypothetical protein
VVDLDSIPPYAIVSHTWGRWRIPGEGKRLNGVLWAVPANSRFDVKTLPAMIQKASFSEKYVWIDLFCIPQDCRDTEQQDICRSELMRQAFIFKNANTAAAWLFEIDDWRPTAAALAYLAIYYDPSLTPRYGQAFRDLSAKYANDRCGLLLNNDVPVSWFSSL